MADVGGTRIRVGIVGASTFGRIRANLDADATALRLELVTKATAKLGVLLPSAIDRVPLFFLDGDPIDDLSLLEKDDTVLFAFDGGGWREPYVEPAGASLAATSNPAPTRGSGSDKVQQLLVNRPHILNMYSQTITWCE